ncbi:phosphotransferase [Citricoccus sp. GCM10030269]|uniref:phosphotransferase n=1 Tax=Citricoccus sp. GCM10030269 TaxID=3273388 RepID=UPI003618509D
MELAALASAAIPDLSPTGVVGSPDDPRDFSAAVVFDRQGSRWRVRSPLHEEAAMRLETELQVLSGFSPAIRAALPFRVPSVAGAVRRDGMRTFVYHDMPGQEMELEDLTELGGKTSEDIGRVIAAIHALPAAVVENADLPVYTADQFRQRRLNELDQAATTGRIPAVLLRRWENALEEMELWDFTPVVAHGDLHEDNLLLDQRRLVSVTGWTDLHIGDPAEDFAWLASSGDHEFTDAVVEAYWQHRGTTAARDEHLLRRAVLAAEFALAQWLVRGISSDDEEMAAEAEAMLHELQDDVESHGGQEISATIPGPRSVPTAEEPHLESDSDVDADADETVAVVPDADDADDADDDDVVITDREIADRETADPETADSETDEPEDLAPEDDAAEGTPPADPSGDDTPAEDTLSEDTPAEDTSTTALDLDEIHQLDVHRKSDSSS